MDTKEIKDLILKTNLGSTMQITSLVTLWGMANYFNYCDDEYTLKLLGRNIRFNKNVFYNLALAGSYVTVFAQYLRFYNIKLIK